MPYVRQGMRLAAGAMIGAAMICGAQQAQAGFVIAAQQVGNDVVLTGSGTINLNGLTLFGPSTDAPEIWPANGSISLGKPGVAASVDLYEGFSGPVSFGANNFVFPFAGGGDEAGVSINIISSGPGNGAIIVPAGYVSGTALSDTTTYHDADFASLGIPAGTYVWSWSTDANGGTDSVTLEIPALNLTVPEPASLLLLGASAAMLAAARRRIETIRREE